MAGYVLPVEAEAPASSNWRSGKYRVHTRRCIRLAWQFTDREGHFLSESSVYRILHAYDLIPSSAFVVLTAEKTFQRPTHRPNELWQTDFTYLSAGFLSAPTPFPRGLILDGSDP